MPTRLSALRLSGALTVVGAATLGAVVGTTFTGSRFEAGGGDVRLTATGVDVLRIADITCTATGGLSKYDTCIANNPLSSTGVVHRVSLEIGNNPAGGTFDCGFNKARETATGATFTNFNNIGSGTGSHAVFSTGSLLWNSADFIKCGTVTAPTSSFTAHLRIYFSNLFGE